MLLHYLLIFVRNLKRQAIYTVVNVAGLTLGIIACLYIYLYVQNETNYDHFHKNKERTYRVIRHASNNGDEYNIGVTSAPYADALLLDFPQDIEASCRVFIHESLVDAEKEKSYQNIALADNNFFHFFSFPLKHGNPSEVFLDPQSVVLSEEMAWRFFDEPAPIGKTLVLENEKAFTVTGILDELSGNSHLAFDFVFNITPFRNERWFSMWWNNNLYTYIRTTKNTDTNNLEAQLPNFMLKYFKDDFERTGRPISLLLEPIENIYFNNDTRFDWVKHGNKAYVQIFSITGIFILLIACINFINLSTARASKRAKEVGIRKTMGAYKQQLVSQFLSEAFGVTLLAVLLACTFVEVTLPTFNNYFQLQLPESLAGSHIFFPILILILIVTLISGSYPAFMLSAFQPIKVIKGQIKDSFQHIFLRKALVILQFAISVFLLFATLAITKQMQFLSEKSLGFDKEQILLVDFHNSEMRNNKVRFTEQIRNLPDVVAASTVTGEPGGFYDMTTVDFIGEDKKITCRTLISDYAYTNVLGLDIIAGENFNPQSEESEMTYVLLNEAACKKLGWEPEEVIGRELSTFMTGDIEMQVVGIVSDYNFLSLKSDIEPLIICNIRDLYQSKVAIKLAAGNLQKQVAAIDNIWNNFSPDYPMQFNFLDDSLNQLYNEEIKQQRIFILFASVSIFIACLGIFGLASFTANFRQREIGIRKVLGATIPEITLLLTKDFIWLVLIAAVFACPLGWWYIDDWLQQFAYRTALPIWLFILAISITLSVAICTVSAQTIRAAMNKAVNALKSE